MPPVLRREDASLHWERLPPDGSPLTQYRGSGTISLKFFSVEPECTFELTPSSFTVPTGEPGTGVSLFIDYTQEQPLYSFLIIERAVFTSTYSCPGKDPVVTPFNGFVLGGGMNGTGHLDSPTDLAFSGETNDPVFHSTWSFTRN